MLIIAILHLLVICSFIESTESRWTPRYLTHGDLSMVLLLMSIPSSLTFSIWCLKKLRIPFCCYWVLVYWNPSIYVIHTLTKVCFDIDLTKLVIGLITLFYPMIICISMNIDVWWNDILKSTCVVSIETGSRNGALGDRKCKLTRCWICILNAYFAKAWTQITWFVLCHNQV